MTGQKSGVIDMLHNKDSNVSCFNIKNTAIPIPMNKYAIANAIANSILTDFDIKNEYRVG
jgi:hypothetical protein